MSTKMVVIVGVLVALAVAVEEVQAATIPAAGSAKGCTITLQFDTDLKKINKQRTNADIIKVLATDVFKVPASQIQPVGSIDQSGIITSQSVVSFRAVPAAGAATATDPCAACKDATSRRWLGLRGSSVQADIAKATDTWWPGDKAKVQKATCSAS